MVEALFFGLKAAVLAIVLEAVVRIGRRALKNNVMVALAAAAFVAIFFFDVPFPLIILTAALVGFFGGRAGLPAFLAGGDGHGKLGKARCPDAETALGEACRRTPALVSPGRCESRPSASALARPGRRAAAGARAATTCSPSIAVFFSKMAVVTFGGAYAVLAYVAQQAVETYGWLEPGEMLDGLGLAETTPGPLIMVTQFVGFMGAFRDPGALQPLRRRHARRPAHHLGDLRALLPLDFPRRAVRRGDARQPARSRRRSPRSPPRSSASSSTWLSGSACTCCSARCARSQASACRSTYPCSPRSNRPLLVLTLAAIVAVFHLKIGMIPVLAACAALGIAYHLAGGSI